MSGGKGLVSAALKGGRSGFSWFQGGKDWFWLVQGGKDWFRVGRTGFGWFRLVPLFSNHHDTAFSFSCRNKYWVESMD